MNETKYNEPAERFAPSAKKSLYANATAVMVSSENGCCGEIVGWYPQEPNPHFDPSCDCGSGGGHCDTWEVVFKWYNTVFEKETEEAVQAAWNKEAVVPNNEETHRPHNV